MERARGFTLVEVVVCVGIFVVLLAVLFAATSQALLGARQQTAEDAHFIALAQLMDHFQTEEDDAWAIYTPPGDVFGKSNSDGHEVDFFTRDSKEQSYFWAYNWDSSTGTVTRYLFGAPGGAVTQDQTFTGVTKFYAHTYPVTALQDGNSLIYSPLYNGAHLQSGQVQFYAGTAPWISGGNQITYVHMEAGNMQRTTHLSTASAPSGFIIVLNYTPRPSPTASTAFKTWPAYLEVGVGNSPVGVTSGSVVADIPPRQWVARELNGLLGGGIAQAATAGQMCYARGLTSAPGSGSTSSPDTTLPAGAPIQVDSNGCELDSSGNPVGPSNSNTEYQSPVILAYEPSQNSETFGIPYNGCGNGTAATGSWIPSKTGVDVMLGMTGQAAGSCTVDLSDGVSTQTPAADAGSATVDVIGDCPASMTSFGPGGQCYAVMSIPSKTCGTDNMSSIIHSQSFSVSPAGAATIDLVNASSPPSEYAIITSQSSAQFVVTDNGTYDVPYYDAYLFACEYKLQSITQSWTFN